MTRAEVLATIEAHLSTGLGCHCGEWRLDTSQRPVDPRAQHRAHVADILAADLAHRASHTDEYLRRAQTAEAEANRLRAALAEHEGAA